MELNNKMTNTEKIQRMRNNARVWIYQSNRELSTDETLEIENKLAHFTENWTAHNQQLLATAFINYNRFIVLMVDESQSGASGCSIDKSVNFIKEIEKDYQIDLFDRLHIAYKLDYKVDSLSASEFEKLIKAGIVNQETIVFNNLVNTKLELATNWELPINRSWHKDYFSSALPAISID